MAVRWRHCGLQDTPALAHSSFCNLDGGKRQWKEATVSGEGVRVVKAGASMRSKDRAASFYTWVRYAADNIELSRQYAVWRLWTYDLMPLYISLYYYIIIIIYSFLFTKSGSNINNDKNNRKHNYQQLVKYYSSLQKWQKPFTVKIYRNLNLSCLLLRTQLGRSIAKAAQNLLLHQYAQFKKSFIQRRLKVKSKECRSALPNWKHSNPYNKIGVHLVLTSSKMTSSDAKFRSFPNKLLAIIFDQRVFNKTWLAAAKRLLP